MYDISHYTWSNCRSTDNVLQRRTLYESFGSFQHETQRQSELCGCMQVIYIYFTSQRAIFELQLIYFTPKSICADENIAP